MTAATNPWGVSPAEAQTLDLMLVHGRVQEVAKVLGRSRKTIETHLTRAGAKVFEYDRPPLLLFVAWDRYRREAEAKETDAA